LQKIIEISKDLQIKIWRKYKNDDANAALQALFTKER
jgi:hypothetical protein